MITINVPGWGTLQLENIVLDFNGTMAEDGRLIEGVEELLNQLAELLNVYVLTADTFGTSQEACRNIKCKLYTLSGSLTGQEKLHFVQQLGTDKTVAVGNGNNDCHMLQACALGIVVMGREGTACKAIQSGDILARSINDALELLLNSKRIVASLRL